MKLDDLYFDILFKDKTDDTIKQIKKKLDKAKIKASITPSISIKDIQLAIDKATSGKKDLKFKINAASISRTGLKQIQTSLDSRIWYLNNVDIKTTKFEDRLAKAVERAMRKGANSASVGITATDPSEGGGGGGSNSSLKDSLAIFRYIRIIQGMLASSVFTNFIRKLADTYGRFEQQLVALKSMLQSGIKGNTIFNQIKEFSVKSPFQFSELVSFTKQLTAFQVPYNELFDTTKRLADLSAGLGVDMSRIILAYGQVRSASYLRGQELRQFTEAGVPILQLLADKFSQLEQRVVSVGDVFDYVSKRKVPFEMVKEVIQDMTNEGGIFYKMQERQAETLRGRITNLADAYDVLLYNIGKSGSANVIGFFVGLAQKLLQCKNLIMAIGAAAMVVFARIIVAAAVTAKKAVADMMAKAGMSLIGWRTMVATGIAAVTTYFYNQKQDVDNAKQAVADFAKESSKNILDFVDILKNIDISIKANGGDKAKTLVDAIGKLKDLMPENQANSFVSYILGGDDIDKQISRLSDVRNSLEKIEVVMRRLGESKPDPYQFGVLERTIDFPAQIEDIVENGKWRAFGSKFDPQSSYFRAYYKYIGEYLKGAIGDMQLTPEELNEVLNQLVSSWASTNEVFSGKGGDIAKIVLQLGFNADEKDIIKKSTALAQYYFQQVEDVAKESGKDLQGVVSDALYGSPEQQNEAKQALSSIYEEAGEKAKESLGTFYDEFDAMVQRMQANPIDIQIRARLGFDNDALSGYSRLYIQRLYDKQFGKGSYYLSSLDATSASKKLAQSESSKYILDIIKNNSDPTSVRNALENAYDGVKKNIKNSQEANDGMTESYKEQLKWIEEAASLFDWNLNEVKETKTKTDEVLKSEKDRYSTLKKYIQEYDKLVKLYGQQGALDKLNKQSQFGMFTDKEFIKSMGGSLNVNNKADLLSKYADYLEKKIGKGGERGSLIKDIRIEAESARLEQEAKDAADAIEQLKKEISNSTKRWEMFNKALNITGDKDLSNLLAFGRTTPFSNQQKEIESQLKQRGVSDVASLKGIGTNELTRMYGAEIATLIGKYFEIVEKEQEDSINEIIKVLEKAISQDTKIKGISDKYAKLRDNAKNLGLSPDKLKEIIDGLTNAENEEIAKTKWDFFKKTPEYAKMFEELDRLSNETISDLLNKLIELNPQIQDDVASFKELQSAMQKLREELKSRNPFSELSSSARNIGLLNKIKFDANGNATINDKNTVKALGIEVGSTVSKSTVNDALRSEMSDFEKAISDISEAFDKLSSIINPVIDLFDSLGMSGASDILGGVQNALGAAGGAFNGMNSLSSITNGMGLGGVSSAISTVAPYVGAAMGAVSIVSSIFALHDKALQKQIDALKREEKSAKALYDLVEKRLEYTLGKGYGADSAKGIAKGTTYLEQRKNLLGQLKDKQKELELQLDKKKKDKDAIADLNSEIADMRETIKQLSMELADDLFSINLSDWASQIGDSLVEAFSEGRSALDAFDEAAGDILKNVVKNMAQLYILEPALNRLRNYLFGSDGTGGVFGSDMYLSQEDLEGMIPLLASIKDSVGNVRDLYDAINEVAKQSGIDLSGISSGLSGSIQNITEDTADLLASYLNAIRARLMVMGSIQDVALPYLQDIAEAQLRELELIVENTRRNAESAERIESALNSVILVGSSGKQIKVKAY